MAVTLWHEDRLLIDGVLVAAENGATYENVSPSTEEVLGTAADASLGDARRAVAAARRAFDTTDWSRDVALRRRCLAQLHQALLDNVELLRPILVHEVGAPVAITAVRSWNCRSALWAGMAICWIPMTSPSSWGSGRVSVF